MYSEVSKFSEGRESNIIVNIHLLKSPVSSNGFCDDSWETNVREIVNGDPDKVTISINNEGIFIEGKWVGRGVQQNHKIGSNYPNEKRVECGLDLAFAIVGGRKYHIKDVTMIHGDVLGDDGYPSYALSTRTKLIKYGMNKDYVLRWLNHILKLEKI